MIKKALLTYVGINRKKPEQKNKQFSVEITGEELNRIKTFPFPTTYRGTVTRAGAKSTWKVGESCGNFCNPFADFYRFHHAGWIIETCICEGSFHDDNCPLRVK